MGSGGGADLSSPRRRNACSVSRSAGIRRGGPWACHAATWGMVLAHFGRNGVFRRRWSPLPSAWQVEKVQLVRPGDRIEIAALRVRVQRLRSKNRVRTISPDAVTFEGHSRSPATADRSRSWSPPSAFTRCKCRADDDRGRDPYAVDRRPLRGDQRSQTSRPRPAADRRVPHRPDAAWAARIYYNPLVPWIWIGALIMAFGGIVSLTDRRHRIGAPVQARPRLPAATASAAE